MMQVPSTADRILKTPAGAYDLLNVDKMDAAARPAGATHDQHEEDKSARTEILAPRLSFEGCVS
jgi:hypothetical protein